MTVINPLVNGTCGEMEPHFYVEYYYIMDPRAVSSFSPFTSRVFSHDDIVSVRIIIS